MEKIYNNYSNAIKSILQNGSKRGQVNNDFINFSGGGIHGIDDNNKFMAFNENEDMKLYNSLQPLSSIAGRKAKYDEKPGLHPDFIHIKQLNSSENHYITSMFIDIKNSTGLFKKYTPATVANITTTIQRAAIHTCWYFDGFIQRFHGDGLFIYFGGRNQSVTQSISNALNAASFISYFIKNDLRQLFSEQDIENIYTRIGIDTGLDEDVLWHLAGMKDCSEVTTCSLHTSLAAKMQNNADSNGIMLGDNVKVHSNLSADLFDIKENNDRYIFQIPAEGFNYTQWRFNWEKYLKTHPALYKANDGSIQIKTTPTIMEGGSANINFLKSKANDYRPYGK